MKQSCDDLFYTTVMKIKVKQIPEEEKKGIDSCGLLLLRCHVM